MNLEQEKEKKEKKEKQEEKILEDVQKPNNQINANAEQKIEKSEEKRETQTEIIIKKKKEPLEKTDEPTITGVEKQILFILDLVDHHKSGLKLVGFQMKDFLENIFPGVNVDNIWAQLKEQDRISKTKDSEEFFFSWKGRQEVAKFEELLKPILELVGAKLEILLKENDLLKRILYISYSLSESKVRDFLLKIKDQLSEFEQVLSTFFSERAFFDAPIVSKTIRILRKEQPPRIKELLIESCKDLDFLKSLAVLRMDELKRKMGIETIAAFYYKNYGEILSEIVDRSKTEEILKKILLLGITESENFFGIDIDDVLIRDENISRLNEWVAFDQNAFKKQLEVDWNLFLNAKKAIENTRPIDLDGLISAKAVLFHKENLLVRKEVKEIFNEIYEKLKGQLRNKVKDIQNTLVLPFYEINFEQLKELKGKIIIILHAYDWWSNQYYYNALREEELENNVILLISPKEIGYKEKINDDKRQILGLPDKNVEFNAIGDMENLEQIKSIYNSCEWVLENEHYPVKRAKERIWEKANPPISIEEAINELKKGLEGIDGKILLDALLISVNIPTNYTAVFLNRDFNSGDLWQLIEKILMLKYGIGREQFIRVKERIEEIIEGKVRIDLLTFGLGSRPGSNIYYDKLRSIQKMIYKNCDIQTHLKYAIQNLDQKSKEILWIYLTFFINSASNIYFRDFKIFYESIFNKNLGSLDDVLEAINKSGISIVKKLHSELFMVRPFSFIIEYDLPSELVNLLEQDIRIVIPQIEPFIEKYKTNILELVGVDCLVQLNGYCESNRLRDIFLEISREAWNDFESYDGIISSKDKEMIALNPLLLDELRTFVNTRKKDLIESQPNLKKTLSSIENLDYKIEFDEELSIFKGLIVILNKLEIKIIISPWYLPRYESELGEKTLIVVTNHLDYNLLVESLKVVNKEIILLFLKNGNFYLFSSFKQLDFVNKLLVIMETHDFTLISKEIINSDTQEKQKVEDKSISQQIIEEVKGKMSKALDDLTVLQEKLSSESEGEQFVKEPAEILKTENGDLSKPLEEELDLFGEFFKTDGKGFPIGLGTEEPVVIILSKTKDDDYGAMLQIICREVYRELIKGLPRPKRITNERIEEELDVSDKIIFVDDNKAEKLGIGKISKVGGVNWVNLGKKLQEFYSRHLGFLIFEIPSDKTEEFKNGLEKHSKDLRPRIIQVFPMFLGKRKFIDLTDEGITEIPDLIEFKKKICCLFWGFVIPKGDNRWEKGETFDNFFSSCEMEYKNRLRNVEFEKIKVENEEISVQILVKSVKNEGDVHFRIKVFIVKYLYEIEKRSKNSIITEQKIEEDNNIPDVQFGNTVFEVETLYNSVRPLSRLVNKARNYKNSEKQVIIVLKNIDVFLYYKYLIDLEKELRKEGIDVEFKTLNLKENKLMHIKEIGKSYSSFFK